MTGSLMVDSSFYIGRLREGKDPLEQLAAISEEWEIITCGTVIVEVCRGLRSPKARDRLLKAFSTMIQIPTTPKLWQQVMHLAWELDRQGRIMQVTDLTIAACALHVDAMVLTHDGDFANVPGLSVISELPG